MTDEIIRDMRAACDLMGWQFLSGDHFVRQAIEFLTDCQTGLTIVGNDRDGWNVKGPDYSAGGDTLIDALCGAVVCMTEK